MALSSTGGAKATVNQGARGPSFPSVPSINPLRLASDYRDFPGDPHARFTRAIDRILNAGCYVPRYVHAPDQATENAGVDGSAAIEYTVTIKPGSFILGFLHSYTSSPSANTTDAPVTSSFTFRITDLARNYLLCAKPLPETWLLNDQPGTNPEAVIGGGPGGGLYVVNPSVRLLTRPYPVAPPGAFLIEFWNQLTTVNTDVRLTMLVAEPARAE